MLICSPKTRNLRKYLWAIAYPKILDKYAETEIMKRVENIRQGLSSVREKTEQVIKLIDSKSKEFDVAVCRAFCSNHPGQYDEGNSCLESAKSFNNTEKWRDEKRLIYQGVLKPEPTAVEISNTKIEIEVMITHVCRNA